MPTGLHVKETLAASQAEVTSLHEERGLSTEKFDALISDRESIAVERRELAAEVESQRRHLEGLESHLKSAMLQKEVRYTSHSHPHCGANPSIREHPAMNDCPVLD